MERINLFFLHGFLGCPQDWDEVISLLPSNIKINCHVIDYFREKSLSPENTFLEWSHHFNEWACRQVESQEINILVGYSLGGRLALHAFEENPSLWRKLILISVNPGFDDDCYVSQDANHDEFISNERQARWCNDNIWAQNFLDAPWEEVIRRWNQQPVFQGVSLEPLRHEMNYNKELLSLALRQWSLAQQKNFKEFIREQVSKIVWLVGDRDQKFLELSLEMKNAIQDLNVKVISEASHRVIFDRPQNVAIEIKLAID
jgi:2-succinyl-6-hydroxy-2,4-cyclohexadiene-1-carboxylate synthase